MDHDWDWERSALDYEWLVPWRYARGHDLWYQGGYSNMALNLLDRHLEARADDSALIDRRSSNPLRLRYRDLYWDSARLARWWEKRGLGLGHRVLLYGSPDTHLMTALLALARLGATVVRSPETTDALLIDRVLATETHWAVVSVDATPQVLRLQHRLGAEFQVISEAAGGCASVPSAMAEAEGLLDPVPIEANHIGAVLWGDDPAPYAYAGMGGLVGWHQSLKRLLDLGPGDRVGIMSRHGGLLDPLWVTAAVMAEGCPVVWLGDDARAGVREHGLTKVVAGGGYRSRLAELSARLDRIVLFGEQRQQGESWASRRADVVWARADMTMGLYVPLENTQPIDTPSHDRSRMARSAPETGTGPKLEHREQEILALAMGLEGVEDAVIVLDDASEWHLWLATAKTADDILSQMAEHLAESHHVHTVSALPETIEGRLATSVLQAVQRREPRLSVLGLSKPHLVEELVRAAHSPEQ